MTEQKKTKEAVAAHYGLLLGISRPRQVKETKLKVEERLMDIEVVHDASRPVLGLARLTTYHGSRRRKGTGVALDRRGHARGSR